jgi:hypothetical protein
MIKFCTIFFFSCLSFVSASFCATISSISQDTSLNFGTIDPLSGGTIANCTPSGPKILTGSSCTNASFTVVGEDSAGANSTTFVVFITNPNENLTSSGGGSAAISFSLSSGSNISSQTYNFAGGSGSKNFPLSAYGTLTLGNNASQAAGSYNGNYTITACSCNNDECPSSASDSLCN